MNTNILDGWKKPIALVGGGATLGLDTLPDRLVWPFVVVLAAYLLGQSAVDAAKAWKASK